MADGGARGPIDCGRPEPGPDESRVGALGLDAFELAALVIMRRFFASFADPASQGWLRAAQTAETCFGGDDPGARFLDLLRVVQAMRMARASPFRFASPDCARCAAILTATERHLMLAMQAARRGRRGAAEAQALMLCEGGDSAALMAALGALPPALRSSAVGNGRPH